MEGVVASPTCSTEKGVLKGTTGVINFGILRLRVDTCCERNQLLMGGPWYSLRFFLFSLFEIRGRGVTKDHPMWEES